MIVCADAHIGERPETLKAFFEACDTLEASRPSHFVVLGDLFDFFIGLPGWATPEQTQVFDRIRRLKEAGIFTAYIEGNRDFFLKDTDLCRVFNVIGPTFTADVKGHKILFVHGDTLNRRDWRYLTWRAISKSPPIYGLTRILPRPLLLRLYRWTERRLKRTNFRYRKQVPLEAVRAFAARHAEVEAVVLGHFHREFSDSAGGVRIFGLPAFQDTGRFWTWEPGP